MKYKLVIFDWDGTLMDSVSRIVSSMQAAARISGAVEPESHSIQDIIGLSLDISVNTLFPDANEALQKTIHDHYKDQYVNHDKTPTPLFDGAIELLSGLKSSGYTLAVATGKGRKGLDRVIEMSGTGQFFQGSRCADESASKPSPMMLQQLLDELGMAIGDAVMIGDSEYDLMMAKALGMDCIGVSFGTQTREKLQTHQPLAIIDQLSELRDWV